MVRFILAVCLLLCLLPATGCKTPEELNNIGIVVAVALDRDLASGDILVTSEVIRPAALDKKGARNQEVVDIVTGKGSTIFEAVRNTTQILDRINFYAHTKVIIVDETLAKEGLTPLLDFFVRGRQLRGYTLLCIAKQGQAKDILNVKTGVDVIPAIYLRDTIKNTKYNNKAVVSSVVDYYRDFLKEGNCSVLGVVEVAPGEGGGSGDKQKTGAEQVKSSGAAVFKKDRLAGYLDETETQGLNWLVKELPNGLVTLPSRLEPGKLISLEIESSKTSIKPEYREGKLCFVIQVETELTLVEQQGKKKILAPKAMLDYLGGVREDAEREIGDSISRTILKTQNEFDCDVVGFASALKQKEPEIWRTVADNWEEVFPTVDHELHVQVHIVGTALKQGFF